MFWKLMKYAAPVAVGGVVAYGVWYFMRGNAQEISADEQNELEGIRALRGYTQGSFTEPNLLKPLAQSGLQQMIFRAR